MTATDGPSPQALARDGVDEMLRSGDSEPHIEDTIGEMNLGAREREALSLYAKSRARTPTPLDGWSA